MHTVRAGITTALKFFIEMRIPTWANINTCFLSDLKDFFEGSKIDTTVRQDGFYHVDIVMAGESREVQNMGDLGVEIELNIRTDVVHVPDDGVPQGDVLLTKEVTGRVYPDIPAPVVGTLGKLGYLLDDGVHKLERRMYSHEPVNHTLVQGCLVETLALHSVTGSCTVCTVHAGMDSWKVKDQDIVYKLGVSSNQRGRCEPIQDGYPVIKGTRGIEWGMNVVLEEFNGRCKGLAHGDNLKCAIGLCVIDFPFDGRNKRAPTIFELILQAMHF